MRRHRRARGQALLEFAFALPVFVLMVFALLDIGRLVYINNAIAQGAREAARWGSVQGRSATAGARTAVAGYARGVMAAVPNPTVTVTCQDGSGNTLTTCTSNNILVVAVQSRVGMITPVIAQIVGTINVNTTSQVVVNQ